MQLNETNDGHKVLLLGGAGKDHGGLLIPTKGTMETYPVLIDQGNLIISNWDTVKTDVKNGYG